MEFNSDKEDMWSEFLTELNDKLNRRDIREEVKKTNKRLRVLYDILTEAGFPEDIQRIIAMKLYGTADKQVVPKRVNFTDEEKYLIARMYPEHDKDKWQAIYK